MRQVGLHGEVGLGEVEGGLEILGGGHRGVLGGPHRHRTSKKYGITGLENPSNEGSSRVFWAFVGPGIG
jgi:hypothetical protein